MPGPAKTVTLKLYADSAEAQRKLDDIYAKAEELGRLNPEIKPKIDKAAATAGLAVLRKELKATQAEADKLGSSSGKLAKSAEALGTSSASAGSGLGAMATPMAAAIGAGVALSPILVTLGTGMAGFGAAAIGVIKPIENAAKKTGGLQANMKLLNPEQQKVARGLLGLGQEYGKFQKSMQPEVFRVFNSGLHLAGNLMHDVQPVAKATGGALATMLDSVSATFASGTWQHFFGWMAAQAGPDMKLLGGTFTDLLNVIPPLMQTLNPLAVGLLRVTDQVAQDSAKISTLASDIVHLGSVAATFGHQTSGSNSPFRFLDNAHLLNGIKFVNDILPRAFQHAAEGAAGTKLPMDGFFQSTRKAGSAVYTTGQNAFAAAARLQTMATAVTALNTAESTSLNNQLAYTNALLASKQGAIDLRMALKASGDKIGYHTQKERDSFSKANTYIGQLEATALASWKSGHGTDGAATAIRNALPLLDKVKTKNRDYWQELRTLKGWLDKLNAEKMIHDVVKLSGTGAWTFGLSGTGSFPSRHIKGRGAKGVKGAAAGVWLVGEQGPELAWLPKGTHVLPAAPTAKVMGGLAGGTGLVPSYAGSAGGLKPWGQGNFDATITAMTQAFVRAGKAQQAAFASTGGPASFGVTRWAPLILKVLAMLGQSSANLGPVEHRMQQESGGNPFAINLTDSNAAAGDPSRGLMQTIGSTFARYRSWALPNNIYNPESNIFAGLNYALHAYAGRSLSSVMLQAGGYDSGGWLPPGASIAVNKTGRAEQVIPPGGGELAALLAEIADGQQEIIGLLRAAPHHTGRALGDALNGVARSSAYSSMYGSR